jgi:hypothetical protein
MLRHQLEDRYLRIDTRPGEEQQADMGMDIADESAQGTLLGLAEGSHQQYATNTKLLSMLAHCPGRPIFYHSKEIA